MAWTESGRLATSDARGLFVDWPCPIEITCSMGIGTDACCTVVQPYDRSIQGTTVNTVNQGDTQATFCVLCCCYLEAAAAAAAPSSPPAAPAAAAPPAAAPEAAAAFSWRRAAGSHNTQNMSVS